MIKVVKFRTRSDQSEDFFVDELNVYKFLRILLRSLKNLSTENFMSELFWVENPLRQPACNKLNLVIKKQ